MGSIFAKLTQAIRNPEMVLPYLRKLSYTYLNALRSIDVGQITDSTGYIIIGKTYFDWRYDDQVVREIQGSKMNLQMNEVLPQQLVAYGIREPLTTKKYKEQLKSLRTDVEGKISVLEIGANIGYYALIAANTLENDGQIYAIEPVKENYNQLVYNVNLNGYQPLFTLRNYGMLDYTGEAAIKRGNKANQHTLSPTSDGDRVTVKSPTDCLDDFGLSPEQVNVIRMDIEGTELALLTLFEMVLTNSDQVLLQIEMHPPVDNNKFKEFCKLMNSNDVELIQVVRKDRRFFPSGWGELSQSPFSDMVYFELIAKK